MAKVLQNQKLQLDELTGERNDGQGKLISINNLSAGFEFYHIYETLVNGISNNFIVQICGYLLQSMF